ETTPSNVYGSSTQAVKRTKLQIKVHYIRLSVPNNETTPSNVYGSSTQAAKCTKLQIKVQKVVFQNQEDDPQRKRVAQRTLLVREHTQAFDGEAYSMSNNLR
ncbi:MAG TPA: hypothetical protein IAA29_01160, partial [Candidatus Paenibacillus intestinavium]|nr:hypothetical protein [Candidatus Paenibacillus intestinavium]